MPQNQAHLIYVSVHVCNKCCDIFIDEVICQSKDNLQREALCVLTIHSRGEFEFLPVKYMHSLPCS